jgi:hypothetical protein
MLVRAVHRANDAALIVEWRLHRARDDAVAQAGQILLAEHVDHRVA